MTVTEFNENITTWWELKEFCDEYNCWVCDSIYDDDSVNDYINNRLYDMARDEQWEDVRSWLDQFADGYGEGYYHIDEYEDITYLDDEDFINYKDEVLAWALDHDVVEGDTDEEDDEDEDCELEEEATPYEAAEFSFDELYNESHVVLNTIQRGTYCDAPEAINVNELWV